MPSVAPAVIHFWNKRPEDGLTVSLEVSSAIHLASTGDMEVTGLLDALCHVCWSSAGVSNTDILATELSHQYIVTAYKP